MKQYATRKDALPDGMHASGAIRPPNNAPKSVKPGQNQSQLDKLRFSVVQTSISPPQPNTAQTRSNVRQEIQNAFPLTSEQRGQAQGEMAGNHHVPSRARMTSATDISSLLDSSTADVPQFDADFHAHADDDCNVLYAAGQHVMSEPNEDYDEDEDGESCDDDDDDDEQVDNTPHGLNRKQQKLMEAMERAGADSFPSTDSWAAPSLFDRTERQRLGDQGLQQSIMHQPLLQRHIHSHLHARQASPPSGPPQQALSHRVAPVTKSATQAGESSQEWSNRQSNSNQRAAAPHSLQTPYTDDRRRTKSNAFASTNTAQPGSSRSEEKQSSFGTRQQSPLQALEAEHVPQERVDKKELDRYEPDEVQSSTDTIMATRPDLAERGRSNVKRSYSPVEVEQPPEPSPILDYPMAQLRDMSYEDVKAVGFDSVPGQPAGIVPNTKLDDLLEDKLRAVAAFDAADQATFFASLTIDEWDDTGDWFLSRFAGVINKLKQARQEKRKVSRSFENEIEKRHTAIIKKRKETDDALAAMRHSGTQVLESTPKKTKTMH